MINVNDTYRLKDRWARSGLKFLNPIIVTKIDEEFTDLKIHYCDACNLEKKEWHWEKLFHSYYRKVVE